MNLNQLLIWIVITLAVVFLLALLSLPTRNYGKKLLTLFVVNFVLHFLNIFFSEFSSNSIPINLNPFFSSNYGPLLWLYFLHFKKESGSVNTLTFLYFLPTSLFLVWGILRSFTFNEIILITVLVIVINVGFIIKCISHYFKNENIYSLPERKWLLSLVGLFTVLLIAVSINLFFSIAEETAYLNKTITLVFILSALLVGSLVYFSIITPEIFKSFKQKYLGSSLNKEDSLELSKVIASHLMKEEKFVDSELTLPKIAEDLDFSKKKISQAINQHLGNNFYDYINSLRIDKAQNMLLNQEFSTQTIKTVMYDCGFNNKVTFNKAFKDRTGLTPTEFRKTKR